MKINIINRYYYSIYFFFLMTLCLICVNFFVIEKYLYFNKLINIDNMKILLEKLIFVKLNRSFVIHNILMHLEVILMINCNLTIIIKQV